MWPKRPMIMEWRSPGRPGSPADRGQADAYRDGRPGTRWAEETIRDRAAAVSGEAGGTAGARRGRRGPCPTTWMSQRRTPDYVTVTTTQLGPVPQSTPKPGSTAL